MIQALFQMARQGDRQAESDMYRMLFDRFVIIVKHRIGEATYQECEDIAQDACGVLMEKYTHLEDDKDFLSWAYTILRHKIGNAYQHRQIVSRARELQSADNHIRSAAVPDPLMEKAIRSCFRDLARQNRRYARVLNLAIQDFTSVEICKRVKITPTNLFSMLSRARRQLLDCLRRKGVDL